MDTNEEKDYPDSSRGYLFRMPCSQASLMIWC